MGRTAIFNFKSSESVIQIFLSVNPQTRYFTYYYIFTENTPVTVKIYIKKTVALLVTKSKLMAGELCVQDLMYAKIILKSFELKV